MTAGDWIKMTCHCGGVALEVRLPSGLKSAKRCDCSFCRRRGAMSVDVRAEDLRVVKQETRSTYRFGRQVEAHHFCHVCGCYTHHERPVSGMEFGVNVGGLEGVNPRDVDPVPWMDGVNWNPEATNALS